MSSPRLLWFPCFLLWLRWWGDFKRKGSSGGRISCCECLAFRIVLSGSLHSLAQCVAWSFVLHGSLVSHCCPMLLHCWRSVVYGIDILLPSYVAWPWAKYFKNLLVTYLKRFFRNHRSNFNDAKHQVSLHWPVSNLCRVAKVGEEVERRKLDMREVGMLQERAPSSPMCNSIIQLKKKNGLANILKSNINAWSSCARIFLHQILTLHLACICTCIH